MRDRNKNFFVGGKKTEKPVFQGFSVLFINQNYIPKKKVMQMAGRKMKLTGKKADKKYQRDRTQKLIEKTKDYSLLQKTPPRILKGKAKWAYKRLYPVLNESGFVKQADLQTVVTLCMNIELLNEAYEDIQKNKISKATYRTVVNPVTGEVIANDFAGYRRNPSTQILDSATAKIKTLGEALGLTPSARASLLSLAKDDENEESLSDMLQKESDF
ncbi:MAG: phage terminase small subunit P27 family [Liquorilactobacillus hordei]